MERVCFFPNSYILLMIEGEKDVSTSIGKDSIDLKIVLTFSSDIRFLLVATSTTLLISYNQREGTIALFSFCNLVKN